MKFKKTTFIVFILLFFIPITNALAGTHQRNFTHIEKMRETASVFFLVHLEVGDTLDITVTPRGEGDFVLFLFDERPTETYVNIDKTLNNQIYSNAVAFDFGEIPHITYKAKEDKIYYVQVILLNNGPDTFILESNRDLTQYYIPAIPGYSLELLIGSIFLAMGLIYIICRKKFRAY